MTNGKTGKTRNRGSGAPCVASIADTEDVNSLLGTCQTKQPCSETNVIFATQTKSMSKRLNANIEAYNLGLSIVRRDLEELHTIHKFRDLQRMLRGLELKVSSLGFKSKTIKKLLDKSISITIVHDEEVSAESAAGIKILINLLEDRIRLLHEIQGLTRSELGREETEDDRMFIRLMWEGAWLRYVTNHPEESARQDEAYCQAKARR